METYTNTRVTFVTPNHATALANAIYSLDEPWRSRFIKLITNQAPETGTSLPTQEELAILLQNRILYRETRTLLRAWTHQ